MNLTFKDLSLEEQELVLKNRLDKLNLSINTGSCEATAVVLTKDKNKIALAIEDKFADKQILLSLDNKDIDMLYEFIKQRHLLVKTLSKVQEVINSPKVIIPNETKNI